MELGFITTVKIVPHYKLVRYLKNMDYDNNYLEPVKISGNNENLTFYSKGQIPLRWIYMLDDFYFKSHGIQSQSKIELVDDYQL